MTSNPFAELSASIPSTVMQVYVLIMIILVVGGTLFDILHKRSARYFFDNWRNARSKGTQKVGSATLASLAVQTAAVEVVTSAEFCNPHRRIAHLLTMYGFLAYVVTTFILVFWYANPATPTPALLTLIWYLGLLMVCGGGYWFWIFIRADVAAEGHSPLRVVRADFFILSLLGSATFGLLWALSQAAGASWTANLFLALYLIATTLLFGGVPWSKFSHMFFKPAAAFQKRVENADGSRSNLPAPADKPEVFGSARELPQPLLISLSPLLDKGGITDTMPTFVYMTRCDGCGHCVDICPSDIMHIDKTYRRAYNIEPNMCWECYSCVKACPQNAIDARGYADFAPLGHSVRVLREEAKGTVSWKIKFRDGREKNFVSPIRTTPWGSIKSPADYEAPSRDAMQVPGAGARAGRSQRSRNCPRSPRIN